MAKIDVQQIKQRFGIIGNNPALNRAIDIALQVAPTDLSVLITGESGVGKETFPQIIHQNSPRKHGQYIAVNCGAIPEGTIDSELFGHEKGSFTGALSDRKGYFEVADGGTIFLDEVGDMPLELQPKLLRVLQEQDAKQFWIKARCFWMKWANCLFQHKLDFLECLKQESLSVSVLQRYLRRMLELLAPQM